jgi:hypothetical protein
MVVLRLTMNVSWVGFMDGRHEVGTSKTLDLGLIPLHFCAPDIVILENLENGRGSIPALFSSGLGGMQTNPNDERAKSRFVQDLIVRQETNCFEGAVLDATRVKNLIDDLICNSTVPEFTGEHLVPGPACHLVCNLEEPLLRRKCQEWSPLETGTPFEKRDLFVVGANTGVIGALLPFQDVIVTNEGHIRSDSNHSMITVGALNGGDRWWGDSNSLECTYLLGFDHEPSDD